MNWTKEHIEEIKEMRKRGMSYSEIGALYGVSRNAVQCVVRRRRESTKTRAMIKEGAAAKIAAGFRNDMTGRPRPQDLEARYADMARVIDGRDHTGQLMGDPPRHDPRRTWAPHLAGGR